MRLLYVYGRRSRFTDIDRDILAGHFELTELGGRTLHAGSAAARSDVVVIWFAGWHAILPATVGWLLRKPVVVITGGYDVANVPEAGYGMQRGEDVAVDVREARPPPVDVEQPHRSAHSASDIRPHSWRE